MRVHPFTVVLAGGALGCVALLGVVVLRSGASDPSAASDLPDGAVSASGPERPEPTARLPRVRGRSVPRFEVRPVIERVPPPAAPPPAGEPPERAALREKASQDGFVFREAGTGRMFMVQNGTRFPIRSQEDLGRLKVNPADIQDVPSGALDFLRDRPAEKTLWREEDNRTIWYYENGQKRFVTSEEVFKKRGFDWKDVRVVPPGALGNQTTGGLINY